MRWLGHRVAQFLTFFFLKILFILKTGREREHERGGGPEEGTEGGGSG